MTKVVKLGIQGIRSFGAEDEDSQSIKFFSPLTLILGQNGCGKTTIIESLKYATGGSLPKGHAKAFVHDPKIAKRSEVYGQVKLKFLDTGGQPVTVVRSLRSSQKLAVLKTSQIDHTLTRIDSSGEPVTLSGRCADIDNEMQRALGVSKPILENVIFCHQEDSTWPLDESKKVKDKFDEIFDAANYIKCLEKIRKLAKEKKSDIRLIKNDLIHLLRNKEEALNKKKNLATFERQIAVARDEIREFDKKLKPITERINSINKVEHKFSKLETAIETKKVKLNGIRNRLTELRESIKEPYEGSTEELRQAILSFKSELLDKEGCLSSLQDEHHEAKREEKQARQDVGLEQIKMGQLQEEENQYNRLSKELSTKLQSLAKKLSISQACFSSDEELSKCDIKNLFGDVEKKMKSLEYDFEKTRKSCKAEEERLQIDVNEARDNKVKIEQEIKMKEQQLEVNENDITKLKAEFEEVQSSVGKLTKLENDLKLAEDNLRSEERKLDIEDEKIQIETLKQKRKSLEVKLEEVNKEVQTLQQQSKINAQLDIHSTTATNKESEVKRLQRKHQGTLKHLLSQMPEKRYKYALETCIEELNEKISSMNSVLREKEKELTELYAHRKHLKDQVRISEDTLRENEEKINEACGVNEYDDVVKNLNKQKEELQDQKGTLASLEHMYKRYIQNLQRNPCCPLCERDFISDSDVDNLVSELNNKVRELPQKIRENTAKLKDMEEKYTKVLHLKPVHEMISSLKNTEIPKLREKVSAIERQIKDIESENEKLTSDLEFPQSDQDIAKSAMNDMILLDQSIDELQRVKKEIDNIKSKMPSSGSDRSMDEALVDQENIQSEMKETQYEFEKKQTDINSYSERISKLREKFNTLTAEKLTIQARFHSSSSIREKMKELEQSRKVILDDVANKKKILLDLNKTFHRLLQEKEDGVKKIHKELDEEKEKLEKLKRDARDVQRLTNNLEEMETKGVEQNVAAARAKLARLEKRADMASSKQKDLSERIESICKELAMQQVKERDLIDNKKLKDLEAEEDVVDTELKKLSLQIRDFKFETLREEHMKLKAEEKDLDHQKGHTKGKLEEKQNSAFNLENELSKDLYKNAEEVYHNRFLEYSVTKFACDDLEKFYFGLDWAMKYFHRQRMESINLIIRELWGEVYKGNDVDYIEIHTDESKEGGSVTMEKRRSFDYKVVMVKDDTEMDMRGRCSAGQKMLASLIIRMALAETFSCHCGILALDEPTTNLDTENSNSLSNALSDIVRRRSKQKNFQLIIITHDEDFIENLAKGENIEKYYVVSRNSKGKSQIALHDI